MLKFNRLITSFKLQFEVHKISKMMKNIIKTLLIVIISTYWTFSILYIHYSNSGVFQSGLCEYVLGNTHKSVPTINVRHEAHLNYWVKKEVSIFWIRSVPSTRYIFSTQPIFRVLSIWTNFDYVFGQYRVVVKICSFFVLSIAKGKKIHTHK